MDLFNVEELRAINFLKKITKFEIKVSEIEITSHVAL